MIDCIFTLDYEIYGNGSGSLDELVYRPAEILREIFQKRDAKFVVFAEVSELEQIEAWGADPAVSAVKQQLRSFFQTGFEIGLHLHPQWCKARHEQGQWILDLSEYNLCTLPSARIGQIVDGALNYLRRVLGEPGFAPLSFRAGNWLFQPTKDAAAVLASRGLRIDSSVFKGGLQRNHTLDYRRALGNGDYWSFDDDVNHADPAGGWIEVPIHTVMTPFWKMPTAKRMSLGNSFGATTRSVTAKLNRLRDFARFMYPLKLDFTRMTLPGLTAMMGAVIEEDKKSPKRYRPVVAIGHTKDLTSPETVDAFLSFLRSNGVAVSTFQESYSKLTGGNSQPSWAGASESRMQAAGRQTQ